MLIDMHVNATARDGSQRDPRKTLEQAKKAGLDGLLVVGAPDDLDRAAWLAAREDGDPRVFFAVPVTTERGAFLCIPRKADADCVPAEWTAAEQRTVPSEEALLARMRDHRAAVVSVQPYVRVTDRPAVGDLVFSFEGINAVETRTLGTDPMAADMAVEAALGMRLPSLAGSGDDKTEPRLGELASLFAQPVEGQGDLVEALLSGDVWSVRIERPRRRSAGRDGGDRRGGDRRGGDRRRDDDDGDRKRRRRRRPRRGGDGGDAQG